MNIKRDFSMLLNIAGFFALVAAEWVYVTTRDGMRELWEHCVPDFEQIKDE